MSILNLFKPQELKDLWMYVNITYSGGGFGNSLVARFTSLNKAKEYAFQMLRNYERHRTSTISSFDLWDRASVTESGYARDNWELTPNTRVWTYWKDDRA